MYQLSMKKYQMFTVTASFHEFVFKKLLKLLILLISFDRKTWILFRDILIWQPQKCQVCKFSTFKNEKKSYEKKRLVRIGQLFHRIVQIKFHFQSFFTNVDTSSFHSKLFKLFLPLHTRICICFVYFLNFVKNHKSQIMFSSSF